MTVEFRASFAHDLKAIRDLDLLARIRAAAEIVEQADRLQDIPNLIKMQGGEPYYRMRVGDYRIGLRVTDNVIAFVRCLNRSEIYHNARKTPRFIYGDISATSFLRRSPLRFI